MRILRALVLTVLAAACGAAPAHAARIEYAVSLGDALATGYQQGADGVGVSSPSDYTQQVFAHARKRDPKLKLRRFGCVGESTRTFRDGSCPGARNAPERLAQLERATRFLRRHAGRIAYVTLSLGGGNFDGCWRPAGIDGRCITAGQARLTRDLPAIDGALRKAAGRRTPIVQLELYNPSVAAYLRGGLPLRRVAAGSDLLVQAFNEVVRDAGQRSHLRFADAYTAFASGALDQSATYRGQRVPLAVAQACRLTQQCLPAPQGNVNPNDAGHDMLAKLIRRQLGL